MNRIDFNKDWDYRQAHWQLPQDRTKVDLPHDYSIEIPRNPNAIGIYNTGYFDGGEIIYSKQLLAPEEWKNKTVVLEFEGVYMNAAVKLNGNIIKKQPYGYTTFHVCLDEYLKYGENNTIEVKAVNDSKNSRWYSGTGIYRPVWLMVADKMHIKPWGTYITTANITEANADIEITTSLEIPLDLNLKDASLIYQIHAPNGESVQIVEININDLISNQVKTSIKIDKPLLWDIETPNLYKLVTILKESKEVLNDCDVQTFGIRKIEISREHGFKLNGREMKIKGGCVHHDNGIIGAASYRSSEERKIKLMQEAGYNAVRCAHNPVSVAFLDACDRLGMLVVDEIFDCWTDGKTPYDYALYFEDWWEHDLESMLLRDRNHPSIIMWSTGNEILERNGESDGYKWAKRLADFVREYDNTRFVTNAACEIWGDATGLAVNVANAEAKGKFGMLTEKYLEPLDVAGYNYLHFRYKMDSELFPERIICGMESYPLKVYENWEEINSLPNVIGDFVWTALDYFGEAGIGHVWYNGENLFLGRYPWHAANCGDFDICGFKRPQSYYRDAVWGVTTTPYIAVFRPEFDREKANIAIWGWYDVVSAWEFSEFIGKEVDIDVYCSCNEVELILNGKTLSRKQCGTENKFISSYRIPYEPGTLTAISYDENGNKQGEYELQTPNQPNKLKLTPEAYNKNSDLIFIKIELTDNEGRIIRFADREVTVDVTGGKLLALGSSDPKSEEMYNRNIRTLYEGRGLAVVKPCGEAVTVIVRTGDIIETIELDLY